MECKHKWVDVGNGTHDQICVKCLLIQKQAVMMAPIVIAPTISISQPMLRETITIQVYGNLIEVYKDAWMKEFNKQKGLGIQMLH